MGADPNGISNQTVQRKIRNYISDAMERLMKHDGLIPKTVPEDDVRNVGSLSLVELARNTWWNVGGTTQQEGAAIIKRAIEYALEADRSHSQTPSYARAVDTPPMRTAIDIWAKLEAIETLVRETHAMLNARGYIHRAP